MKKDYQYMGRVQRVYGLEGKLKIGLEGLQQDALPSEFEKIFVYIQGTYVPYLIKSWQMVDGQAFIKLVNITTRTQATKLRGYKVFIDKKDIVLNEVQDYEDMVGYLVEDVAQGILGHVIHFHERFMQSCLCVAYQNDELLIPLHDAFIQEVSKGKIIVKLPNDYISTLLKH